MLNLFYHTLSEPLAKWHIRTHATYTKKDLNKTSSTSEGIHKPNFKTEEILLKCLKKGDKPGESHEGFLIAFYLVLKVCFKKF